MLALGVWISKDKKDLLGLWLSKNEGGKVLAIGTDRTEKSRHQDMIVACIDGLTGFPEAIATVFPKILVQLCIAHMMRNSLVFVNWKDRKALAAALAEPDNFFDYLDAM